MPKPAATTKARTEELAKRWTPAAIAVAFTGLLLLIASLTVFKMSNNDIWIHLKTGEIILKSWHVPVHDPYSFTAADHDYVAHEWLSGVLFYVVFAAAGVKGLIFFKSAVLFGTCAALYGASRRLKADGPVMFLCFTLMLFIGSARFLERPHIFSYLFEALYLFCYFSYREGGRNRIWLYLIPGLHILWTNLHGGHYQGVFMLVMLAAAEVVNYFRGSWFGVARADALPVRDVVLICVLPPACLVTALVNPYGFRLLTFPFELTGQEVFMRSIYEWQSALFRTYNLSSMFFFYIFWVALLFGSFLAVRRHSELRAGLRETAWMLNLGLGILWAFFVHRFASVYKTQESPSALEAQAPFWYAVVALFLIANAHRLEFAHAGIVALFFALSMRHNRAVTDASIATLPTLSHNLQCIVERARAGLPRAAWWLRPATLAFCGLGMAGLAGFTFTNSYYFGFDPPQKREMGLGIASNMPVGAVDYIQANHITGNCFPSYNAAAMLLQRMWPDVRVAMDSRNDVYGEVLYNEYTNALSGGAALDAYLKKWPVEFFLITYGADRASPFFKYLQDSPDWTLVYFDDRSVVYLKTLEKFAPILRRDGYTLINPAIAGSFAITAAEAPRWLEEAERAVAAAPGAWSPLQYKSKALQALGRLPEAEATTQQILAINPNVPFAWGDLGMFHALRGSRDEAIQDFTRCLEISPSYGPCRDMLDQVTRPR